MPNTITNKTINVGFKSTVIYFTLTCVGAAQETGTIVYDSSVNATSLGIADPLNCSIQDYYYTTNSTAGICKLSWDATTDVDAIGLPGGQSGPDYQDFRPVGGLPNQGGTGRTGDILLTTVGLVAGDVLTLVLTVRAQ